MGVVEIVRQQLIEKAKKEGRKIGLEEGREREREERNFLATRNMLLKNFSVSDICDILEVTPEYVQKVKDQLKDSAS